MRSAIDKIISDKECTIAVDFDGTIVENDFPKIGKPIGYSLNCLLRLKARGNKLILWSCREGGPLQSAYDFCINAGIEFDAVNENVPNKNGKRPISFAARKVVAAVYIDDKAAGMDEMNIFWLELFVALTEQTK